MQQNTQNTEQYPLEAADAASRMAEPETGYEKPFPETTISPSVPSNRLSPSALSASDNLRGHLKKMEGYEHNVADDGSGNPTGGYGNVNPNSKIGDHVGRHKAAQLLEQDIAEVERGVKRLIGNLPLKQNEYDALVDLYFNVGETKMNQKINSKNLRKAINAGNHTAIGSQLIYSLDKGQPSQGLLNRSNSRTEMFNNGIYGKRY